MLFLILNLQFSVQSLKLINICCKCVSKSIAVSILNWQFSFQSSKLKNRCCKCVSQSIAYFSLNLQTKRANQVTLNNVQFAFNYETSTWIKKQRFNDIYYCSLVRLGVQVSATERWVVLMLGFLTEGNWVYLLGNFYEWYCSL